MTKNVVDCLGYGRGNGGPNRLFFGVLVSPIGRVALLRMDSETAFADSPGACLDLRGTRAKIGPSLLADIQKVKIKNYRASIDPARRIRYELEIYAYYVEIHTAYIFEGRIFINRLVSVQECFCSINSDPVLIMVLSIVRYRRRHDLPTTSLSIRSTSTTSSIRISPVSPGMSRGETLHTGTGPGITASGLPGTEPFSYGDLMMGAPGFEYRCANA